MNSFIVGVTKESERYTEVTEIFNYLEQGKLIIVISFYTLLEVYWFCMDNFPEHEAKEKARKALGEILSYRIELIPLLKRADRLRLTSLISIPDASDIPHAMMAFVYKCNYIVAYDSQFAAVSDWIQFVTPSELLHILREQN